MKCPACNGTGRKGLYVERKCYRCSGTGKVRSKKKAKVTR